jgi:hypothetical protein
VLASAAHGIPVAASVPAVALRAGGLTLAIAIQHGTVVAPVVVRRAELQIAAVLAIERNALCLADALAIGQHVAATVLFGVARPQ